MFPAGLGQHSGQDAFGVSLPARQRLHPDAVDHKAGVNPGPALYTAVCTDVLIWRWWSGIGRALADHLAQPIGAGRDSALRQQRVVQRRVREHLLLACQLGGVRRRLALTGQIADKFGNLDASVGRCRLR